MRLILDLQVLQSESRGRGIGRYSQGLADALIRGSDRKPSALLNDALDDDLFSLEWLRDRIGGERIRFFHGLKHIRGCEGWHRRRAEACEVLHDGFIRSLGVDLVHIPSPFEGFGDDVVVGWGSGAEHGPARVATIYDLIPLEYPDVYLDNDVRREWYHRRLAGLAKADLFLAISEYTRQTTIDLLDVHPDRVVNISADTDAAFYSAPLGADASRILLARYGIRRPFVLHTGILESRKNVETLVRAFGRLAPELRESHEIALVADATHEQISNLQAVARSVNLDVRTLVFAGRVPDEDLRGLYGLARATVMPSLSEGFGLPILEAMRCGSPVLAADCTSLPEVVGTKQLLFDPEELNSLTEKLTLILANEDFRRWALAHGEKQQKRFSWDRSARLAHDAFVETVARHRSEGRQFRPCLRRFVVVPPVAETAGHSPCVDSVVASLGDDGDTIIATPWQVSPSSVPAEALADEGRMITGSGHMRILVVAGETGLDSPQRRMLARIPAAVATSHTAEAIQPSGEEIYHLGGYGALLAAKEGSLKVPLATLLEAQPNVLGVVSAKDVSRDRIEDVYERSPLGVVTELLSRLPLLDAADEAAVADAISQNHAVRGPPRLLVDISELVHRDSKTGIQRVVRSVLRYLLTEPRDRRIEPVYRDGDIYRYARSFTCRFLDLPPLDLPDQVVKFNPTDIFFGLDLDPLITNAATQLLRRAKASGTEVCFLVYDVLPITNPDWFPEGTRPGYLRWLHSMAETSNRIIGISRSTIDCIHVLLQQTPHLNHENPIDLFWSHIGCDLENSIATVGAGADQENWISRIGRRQLFLTVGTIEPRKGIAQLLDAAEVLWDNNDVCFAVVGKRGWNVDHLLTRIEQHPEIGKRLFWFEAASDEVLERLYRMATAAVLPSEGEGFGLPLVEAARHGTPIIARNLPVFREIGRDGAFYFDASSGAELARALQKWLEMHGKGLAPSPEAIKPLLWSESAELMFNVVCGHSPHYVRVPPAR